MSLENSNAVAVERRMDLASLFCMIGRHGPAVVVAVIAMVSLLAGFIIYRTVRGKRRKATAENSDGKPPGAERDASVIQPSLEENHSPVRATEGSGEVSPEVKEDINLSDHNIRHRRAAAVAPAPAPAPSPYFPPKDDIRVLEIRHTTSDDRMEMAVVGNSYKVSETLAEEASQSCQSDTFAEAEMVVNDAVDCHHNATNEVIGDVAGEIHDINSCLKEWIIDENNKKDKVSKAECQDDKHTITNKAVPEEETRQEEETRHISETNDDDRLQDNVTIVEANIVGSVKEEPVVLVEGAPVSIICNVKEEESEPQDPDGVVSDHCHTAKEQKKTKCEEAEEECEDSQLNPQQAVIQTSTFEREINLSSTEQDQSNRVMEEVIPHTEGSDGVQYSGPTEEVSEEVTDKDNMDKLPAVNTQSPQFKEKDAEVEQKQEITRCSQNDEVLFDNQVTNKNLANDDIMTCMGEFESSVESSPALPTKAETNDNSLSDITTEQSAKTSGIAECSDLSLDPQQRQKEYRMTTSLDKDTNSTTLESAMLSDDTKDKENDPVLAGPSIAAGDGGNVESLVVAEEESPSHVSSCYSEQQSVSVIHDDVSGWVCDNAVTDVAGNITFSESVRIISYPCISMTCQDQQSYQMENGNFDLVIHPSCEAPACNFYPTAPLTAEETSFPNLLSSPQLQKIDPREEIECAGENSASDAPACNTSLIALLISSSLDQQSVHLKNTTEEISISSATPAFDQASLTPPTTSEEKCQSDMFSSCQDQLSDQEKHIDDFSELTTSPALVMTANLSPSAFPISMPSFEPSDLGYSDLSSPDVGKESGISSMAVSPDFQDSGFDVENIVECDLLSAAQTEPKDSLLSRTTDDITVPCSYNGNTAGMVFGPYPTRQPQQPHTEQTDWTGCESFAANEDIFGHEIEDRYHREMNQFMAQIVDSITSLADELTEEKDTKVIVEVVEKKEKKAEVSVGMKAETKAEEEEAVEFEKTEISIMEATMDNNEWITDSNYQVLPWMAVSSPSIDQNHNRNNQPSSEKCADVTYVSCVDAPDNLPVTEVKPTSSLSLVDENNKKVLAVQPMPQNVNVTFRVHYFTQSPYQTVAVTGDHQELGNWKGFIPLERAKDGHWTTVVSLPAESHVEWKFLLLDKGEVCRWEECGNRLLETGSGDDLLVHKWWGTL